MVTFKCGGCGMSFNITDDAMRAWKLGGAYDRVSACPNCLQDVPFKLFQETVFFMKNMLASGWTVSITQDQAEGK